MLELFSIIAPVFVCSALGFAWTRAGRAYDTQLMTTIIATLGAPCLVFSRLVSLEVDPTLMLQMAGAAAVAMATFALVGFAVLRALGLPPHTFLGPMIYPNAGNMGMAVCLFAFGSEGLALAVCFFTVSAVAQFTVGLWSWAGRGSLGTLLRQPMAYAALVAIALIASGTSTPLWVLRTTELLGGLTIPLMLLTLGASLASLRVRNATRTAALSTLRLGMGFGVGLALSQLLGWEGTTRGVLIVQCSMPVAVFNYLFAEMYDRSPADVASLVLVSTLISYATLPILLAYLL